MPDLHIDGHNRLLDRPLWGKRALHVRSYPSFESNLDLYKDSRYQPPPPPPQELKRSTPREMFDEARRRGLEVHLGIGPFLPPGVHVDDRPNTVDGALVKPPYVAKNACLNSPDAQQYALAAISDLVRHYPDAGGLILDWVEFGAYKLEDHFTCFCVHCHRQAVEWGYDWSIIERDVKSLWAQLHQLTSQRLRFAQSLVQNLSALLEILTHMPGWLAFIRFKAQSVASVYGRVRRQLDDLGFRQTGLTARGWCPPWNRSSGSDYRALAEICTAVSPKLFTFDHAVLPRWAGETIKAWNPQLDEAEILETVLAWMNLADDRQKRAFVDYQIPAPEEAHPARLESYRQRLAEVVAQVGGKTPCYPIAHPYLPARQWAEMVALIRESEVEGMWVNMYGYLSDEKLEILRQGWR